MFSDLDRRLCRAIVHHPSRYNNRYTEAARDGLLEILFRSLTNDSPDYLAALFPSGFKAPYKLQKVQSIQDCAEYAASARGHPCGHIFKQGEASYHCMTCTDDNTCVLCSRCFDSSDHEGHQFTISISGGNSGCCDCGDLEAWKRPVNCSIHTFTDITAKQSSQGSTLPADLVAAVRTTVGRTIDYFCDVISCAPENLRITKTVESIKHDEDYSRLGPKWYDPGDEFEADPEYCLVLWNDEKHTIQEVEDQVMKACRERRKFGRAKAQEAHDIGRTIIEHSRDLEKLIRRSKIIEQIKVTVTIRSSRDTFREQMCGTIVEWLSDIAKCSVGDDHELLRHVICDEMLQQWRVGSEAYNAKVGKDGLEDHERSEQQFESSALRWFRRRTIRRANNRVVIDNAEEDDIAEIEEADPTDDDVEEEDDEDDEEDPVSPARNPDETPDEMDVDEDADMSTTPFNNPPIGDRMDTDGAGDYLDISEATMAGYPPPPPPPVDPNARQRDGSEITPTESEDGEHMSPTSGQTANFMNIPKTPRLSHKNATGTQPGFWAVRPAGYSLDRTDVPPCEDLSKNIRLDSMILFDLRLWKQTRIDLRDLYISTVVNVPQFKRILGLRFSGLYTTLSQLYLVADREPDHSIINLSLQMLTSPSITEEVMERGNFLTNLMAILYTFLTTRQVGFPKDVSSSATLAFDAGSVTNRRLYHFLTDLRYFLASEFVQRKVRAEHQYLLQFLDLAKLCQGICPNTRAVGEHVEYETDAWISASLLTREINKLCRQFAESFQELGGKRISHPESVDQAIFHTAYTTIVNSVGFERQRFDQSEIKDLIRFKELQGYDAVPDELRDGSRKYRVVDFVVEKGAISFHHALHYTLSWLLECGKNSDRSLMTLLDAGQHFIEEGKGSDYVRSMFSNPDDVLLAMFDYPLRVCAWLAQMKAGMWVRNGMSLRHQMGQYKGVTQRDVGYHRDLLLLQTALVTCDPSRVLASMIDRYGLEHWMRGEFSCPPGYEDAQLLDVVEEFLHLLIVLLSDRSSLLPEDEGQNSQVAAVRKDLIHTLCFKPLSFSDLTGRLTERAQETPEFQSLLESMTLFHAPEGLHDSGLFELKPEYLSEVDPYNASFNKNQRDEAENLYKNWRAKQVNKNPNDIVLEPQIPRISGGAYAQLAAFTARPLFAQIIFFSLRYALDGHKQAPEVPVTRIEALLQVVLQLALIATLEDETNEDEFTEESMESFIRRALDPGSSGNSSEDAVNIISVLQRISNLDEYASCNPKIKHMLRIFCRKRGRDFQKATAHLDFPYGRLDTASPANAESEIEAKKKQALERKAKVMAQFQEQQQTFMDNQGMMNWDDAELSDLEADEESAKETNIWKYPSGVCIQCREETNDSRVYGTFAMLTESNVLRQTDVRDPDWVREVLNCPQDLDRPIEDIRPFGVSGENHETIRRINADGQETVTDRQGLGKGWPSDHVMRGPVSSGCSHIMHFACFENYYGSIQRRQALQIARNHPERVAQKEFVCPLCKALGNAFLPIAWKGVPESYPGSLASDYQLDYFIDVILPPKMELQRHSYENTELIRNNFESELMFQVAMGDLDQTIQQWQKGELATTSTGLLRPEHLDLDQLRELTLIYDRLRETLVIAALPGCGHNHVNPAPFDVLLSTLARTISATEITYRGQASDPGSTLLSRIPTQTLTHLRVLSSTVQTYAAIDPMTLHPDPRPGFKKAEMCVFRQLFYQYSRNTDMVQGYEHPMPALLEDSFTILTICSQTLCRVLKLDFLHILHLCYALEVLRVVIAFLKSEDEVLTAEQRSGTLPVHKPTASEIHATADLLKWVHQTSSKCKSVRQDPPVSPFGHPAPSESYSSAMYRALRAYALAFLRKAAILTYVTRGVVFPSYPTTTLPSPDELTRLATLLHLPSLPSLLSSLSEFSPTLPLRALATGWIQHYIDYEPMRPIYTPKLLHPAPLELIGLPKFFDVLIDESHRRRCPTTGKELTEPALCLFCGTILCSQAVCCMAKDRRRGGANLHVESCSGPAGIGIFLNIRKCTVLFLHIAPPHPPASTERRALVPASGAPLSNGSWFPAPYLTKHGEVDPGLRQRHQLILSQKRYDKLVRECWLMVGSAGNSVWSAVARRLEGEVNGGGWESI